MRRYLHAKIAMYASECGYKAAVSKFSLELGHSAMKVQLGISIRLPAETEVQKGSCKYCCSTARFPRSTLTSWQHSQCLRLAVLAYVTSKKTNLLDAKIGIRIKNVLIMNTNFSAFTVYLLYIELLC